MKHLIAGCITIISVSAYALAATPLTPKNLYLGNIDMMQTAGIQAYSHGLAKSANHDFGHTAQYQINDMMFQVAGNKAVAYMEMSYTGDNYFSTYNAAEDKWSPILPIKDISTYAPGEGGTVGITQLNVPNSDYNFLVYPELILLRSSEGPLQFAQVDDGQVYHYTVPTYEGNRPFRMSIGCPYTGSAQCIVTLQYAFGSKIENIGYSLDAANHVLDPHAVELGYQFAGPQFYSYSQKWGVYMQLADDSGYIHMNMMKYGDHGTVENAGFNQLNIKNDGLHRYEVGNTADGLSEVFMPYHDNSSQQASQAEHTSELAYSTDLKTWHQATITSSLKVAHCRAHGEYFVASDTDYTTKRLQNFWYLKIGSGATKFTALPQTLQWYPAGVQAYVVVGDWIYFLGPKDNAWYVYGIDMSSGNTKAFPPITTGLGDSPSFTANSAGVLIVAGGKTVLMSNPSPANPVWTKKHPVGQYEQISYRAAQASGDYTWYVANHS